MFRRPAVKTIALPLAVVVIVKLILKPLAASAAGNALGFPDMWHDIVVVLAAMPRRFSVWSIFEGTAETPPLHQPCFLRQPSSAPQPHRGLLAGGCIGKMSRLAMLRPMWILLTLWK